MTAKPLSAEEESALRKLCESVRCGWCEQRHEMNRLFTTLDASRAETAAYKEAERRAAAEIATWEAQGHYPMPAHGWTCFHCGETFRSPGAARRHFGEKPDGATACLRTLAAELVEGLAAFISVVEHCDVTSGCCMCGDSMEPHPSPMLAGHAPVDMGTYHAEEAYKAAQALIARARAQGVTAPKGEKGSPMVDLDALAALAKAATKGEWRAERNNGIPADKFDSAEPYWGLSSGRGYYTKGSGFNLTGFISDGDAAYIIAAQPANITRILDAYAEMERALAVIANGEVFERAAIQAVARAALQQKDKADE